MYRKLIPLIAAVAVSIPLATVGQQTGQPVVPEQVYITYHIFHVESPAENITGISLEREQIKAIAQEDGIKGVAAALKKEGETRILQSAETDGIVGQSMSHFIGIEEPFVSTRDTSEGNRQSSISTMSTVTGGISGRFTVEPPNGNYELRYAIDVDIPSWVEKEGRPLISRLRTTLSNTTRIANGEKETIVVRTSHTLGEKPVDLIYVITAELKPSN